MPSQALSLRLEGTPVAPNSSLDFRFAALVAGQEGRDLAGSRRQAETRPGRRLLDGIGFDQNLTIPGSTMTQLSKHQGTMPTRQPY